MTKKQPQPMVLNEEDVPQPANNMPAPVMRRNTSIPQHIMLPDNWSTNLDLNTERGKALLFNAVGPANMDMVDGQPKEIVATNYVVHPDCRVDEKTGELVEFDRTVLIDKDGNTFRTSSEFAPKKVGVALKLFPPERWARGISFVIIQKPSRRHPGGSYHDVRIVVQP